MKITSILLSLIFCILTSDAMSAEAFSEATTVANEVFKNLRNLAYILSAFGIAAFAVSAIFGRISFKWLGMIVVGLLILANGQELAEYITEDTSSSSSQSPGTVNGDAANTAGGSGSGEPGADGSF